MQIDIYPQVRPIVLESEEVNHDVEEEVEFEDNSSKYSEKLKKEEKGNVSMWGVLTRNSRIFIIMMTFFVSTSLFIFLEPILALFLVN